MPHLKSLLCIVLTGVTWLFTVGSIAAQTLEHRPPAQPSPPSQSSATAKPARSAPPVLPAGTCLQVEINRYYPMKAGEALEGRLVYPIYSEGIRVLPQNTLLHGTVTSLESDSKSRWHGRLLGDFTPFHTAHVQFDELILPNGPVRFSTRGATTGATVLHLSAPGATPKQSLVKREWTLAQRRLHDQVAYITDPGRGDRALQLLYHQLPYHPERIQAHTAWTFELAVPLALPEQAEAFSQVSPATPVTGRPETWSVHALLEDKVTSAVAKAGEPVRALVIEPVFDKDHELVVPQGSLLIGKVTSAKAARSLGRNGKLRFTFQQVRFPVGEGPLVPDRPVEGALASANPQGTQSLALDAEGTITPKSQSSVIAPLLLTMLAGRALDDDGNMTVQNGVASNGFGLVGRVVGLVAGNRSLAAGLGYYAAALSFEENFLHKGRDVIFPRDTRIEIETTPLRAPVLRPEN
jgi:hypothetical protein